MPWSDAFLKMLKDNDVRLVTYVPDNVLTPLLDGVTSDNYFRSICATREDEAVGLAAGAWMGGMKSVVMMQTSGFALIRIRFMQGLGTSRGGALDTWSRDAGE